MFDTVMPNISTVIVAVFLCFVAACFLNIILKMIFIFFKKREVKEIIERPLNKEEFREILKNKFHS